MDSYNRSGTDRRKQTGINMRMFAGKGARRSIRRQEDQGRIFFVDQYSPVLFVAIVGILFFVYHWCDIDPAPIGPRGPRNKPPYGLNAESRPLGIFYIQVGFDPDGDIMFVHVPWCCYSETKCNHPFILASGCTALRCCCRLGAVFDFLCYLISAPFAPLVASFRLVISWIFCTVEWGSVWQCSDKVHPL